MNGKSISSEIKPANLEHPDVRQVTGSHDAAGLSFGIVVSRFNERLTHQLLQSAVDCLMQHGASEKNITVAWVPGSFEIPSVLEPMAASKQYAALMALGAVIQGETPHAGLINAEVNRSLAVIAQRHGLPVIDGVVMTHTMEQAEARALAGTGGRGWYAARAAIEMARVLERLRA